MSILNQPVNSDNRGFFRNIIDWFRGNSAEPIINDIPIINNPIIETEKTLEEKENPLLIEEEKVVPLIIEEDKEIPLLIEEDKEIPLLIEEDKEIPLLIEEDKVEEKEIHLEEQIVLQNNKKKNKFKGKK
jgi:hypothetical protein